MSRTSPLALAELVDDVELIRDIQLEHERALQTANDALAHAARCGSLLLQAKARVGHGEWAAWVEAHCTFSVRTAQAYMRLANGAIETGNAQRVAHFPLREALKALAEPKSRVARPVARPARKPERAKSLKYRELLRENRRLRAEELRLLSLIREVEEKPEKLKGELPARGHPDGRAHRRDPGASGPPDWKRRCGALKRNGRPRFRRGRP